MAEEDKQVSIWFFYAMNEDKFAKFYCNIFL